MSDPTPGYLTVVSGLPRSGTSMMMQMLQAGGIPIVTDKVRTADEDNPKGYYEFEPVKQTKTDASWVPGAVGQAVKMVHLLLYDLPAGFEYRVVVMRRDLKEVLASQRKMLERLGRSGSPIKDDDLARLFGQQLDKVERHLDQQPHFRRLTLSYNELLAAPHEAVEALDHFLERPLDTEAMLQVVDPTLYRQRRA